MAKPLEQQTRAEQTKYLSREFLIGLVINLIVLIGGGFYAFGKLEARAEQPSQLASSLEPRVAVLESNQVDGERVARLEEAMKNVTKSMEQLQSKLDRNFYGEAPAPKRK